ncbi:hypothetical protein [Dyadobacter frigoris]|uniref:DUF4294 domain-containing protein n=1 Tax=Dyadobacter frigoris TaxID=2576211 RepID=A0A4U6DH91_9BACT|nr:hypothetical protein [Dyadobacter frigoris]TKT94064.1 hypothetical protein FDK13_02310 [Dyadobacter frigoris]
MRLLNTILALSLFLIIFLSQQAIAQKVYEDYCVKEHQSAIRMRKSIIKTYTKGKRAVSQQTAERMATNIEIAVSKECESALKRKLGITKYRRERDIVILNAARNSVNDEYFDLRDSIIVERFFRDLTSSFNSDTK